MLLDSLAMSTDGQQPRRQDADGGDLYTSQCYSGPAKAYGLITPVPSHHVTHREDGGKKSWVLQRDGKPAAFQQPGTDTM